MTNSNIVSTIDRQKAYVEKLTKSNFKFGLTVGTAFVRGIRDIGYKHTGTALDELIDNAFEAGASNVHVILNDDGTGRGGNVTQIAVLDDGSGMIPEMIRLSILWGGTDRENSRSGIGRFGYGLPSSCVSQGRRFEVYSVTANTPLSMCALDLVDLEANKYTDAEGDIVVPKAETAKLPRFVQDYVQKHLPGGKFAQGTAVVISKLDKVSWKTLNTLQNKLLEHLGVVYHRLRSEFDLFVNGKRVEPIDPLFLTSGYRWYDLDADRAKSFDPMRIDVKDKETRSVVGHINVRFSYMPPSFASVDKTKGAVGKNANERAPLLKEYNGFIVARMGRIIEIVRHSPLTTFMNNDRYIKIEIDFDASLDEEFNVPTSKQRVDVSDRIWEILKELGLEKALEQLRKKFREEKTQLATVQDSGDAPMRASEASLEDASKMGAVVPLPIAEKRAEEGRKRLEQETDKRARESGRSREDARREIEAELAGRLYKVGQRSVPGGAFFEVEQIGGTKVLWLNTSTRFFQEVYAGSASSPAVRAALEILLFSIGDRKLDGRDEAQAFYAHEIPEWSKKLELALAYLAQNLGTAGEDDSSDAAA